MGVQILLHSEVLALHGDEVLTGITIRDRETGRKRSSTWRGSSSRSGLCRIQGSSMVWWR